VLLIIECDRYYCCKCCTELKIRAGSIPGRWCTCEKQIDIFPENKGLEWTKRKTGLNRTKRTDRIIQDKEEKPHKTVPRVQYRWDYTVLYVQDMTMRADKNIQDQEDSQDSPESQS
jgi:hypothetical protein